ncbi:MAG: hypothetical protein AB7O80_01020 [Acetobacteraceae bacterium]
MNVLKISALLVAALVANGCETQKQILADESATAVQVATQRGRFELGCPTAVGTVLSSNLLQPVAWRGLERAEYTVGVEGCGKRQTYISVCQLGSVSCFAARGQN